MTYISLIDVASMSMEYCLPWYKRSHKAIRLDGFIDASL